MRLQLIAIFTLAVLLAASQLRSEEPSGEDGQGPQPKVIYKKSESHSFSGLKLKGQLKKPDLSYIYKRTNLRSEKIIDIPENFDEEIVQGAGSF